MLLSNFFMVAVAYYIFNGGIDTAGNTDEEDNNFNDYDTSGFDNTNNNTTNTFITLNGDSDNSDIFTNNFNNFDTTTNTIDTEGITKLHLTEPIAWLGLSIATAICLISGGISFSYVPSSHRNTFYKQKTFKQHVATYWWNDKIWGKDHHNREVDNQEAVRALLGIRYSLHYLPKEKLIELYKNRWADWVADPPEWFDADFRAMIPRELLTEVPPMLWEEEAAVEGTES